MDTRTVPASDDARTRALVGLEVIAAMEEAPAEDVASAREAS